MCVCSWISFSLYHAVNCLFRSCCHQFILPAFAHIVHYLCDSKLLMSPDGGTERQSEREVGGGERKNRIIRRRDMLALRQRNRCMHIYFRQWQICYPIRINAWCLLVLSINKNESVTMTKCEHLNIQPLKNQATQKSYYNLSA